MALPRPRSPAAFAVAFVLGGALAGCLGDETGPAPVLPPAVLTFYGVPESVVVINATMSGTFDFVVAAGAADGCAPTLPDGTAIEPLASLALFDRHGRVWNSTYRPPADGSSTILVPLTGDAPWVFAGQLAPCADAAGTFVTNVTDGYQPESLQFVLDGAGGRRNELETYVPVHAAVAPGSATASALWVADEWTFALYNVYEDPAYSNGSTLSRRTFLDPAGGELLYEGCEPGVGGSLVVLDCPSRLGVFRLLPGEHRWTIDLLAPSPVEVSRGIQVGHLRMNDVLCPLDLDWAFCA